MFFGHHHPGFRRGPDRFENHYQCYSTAFSGRAIDDGDKVLLPASALDTLARMQVDYPMLFRIENEELNRRLHCGVLEFTAEEGHCYLPSWMMENLLVS
jgi:ubiquitin fusion degradation protein 1